MKTKDRFLLHDRTAPVFLLKKKNTTKKKKNNKKQLPFSHKKQNQTKQNIFCFFSLLYKQALPRPRNIYAHCHISFIRLHILKKVQNVMLATVVERNQKAPFSIATTFYP